jgi:hypothetical protein
LAENFGSDAFYSSQVCYQNGQFFLSHKSWMIQEDLADAWFDVLHTNSKFSLSENLILQS